MSSYKLQPLCSIFFHPLKDAYIAEYYPNTNFGQSPYLFTNRYQGANDIYRSLIKFDLCSLVCNYIPPCSCIQSAWLELPIFRNEIPCENTVMVFRLLDNWDEYGVTWNNQPYFDPTPIGSVIVPASYFGTLYIDLTDLVRGWYEGYYPNQGLLLTCFEQVDSLLGFFSREYPNNDLWPILGVQYVEKNKKYIANNNIV